jgi:hypothetical protein
MDIQRPDRPSVRLHRHTQHPTHVGLVEEPRLRGGPTLAPMSAVTGPPAPRLAVRPDSSRPNDTGPWCGSRTIGRSGRGSVTGSRFPCCSGRRRLSVRPPAPGQVRAPRRRVPAPTSHPKRRTVRRTGSRRRRIGRSPGIRRRLPSRVFLGRPAGEGVPHREERTLRYRHGDRQPATATTTTPMFLCPQKVPAKRASTSSQ